MTRRCKCGCKTEIPTVAKSPDFFTKKGYVDDGHMARHGLAKAKKAQEAKAKKVIKEAKAKHRVDKERIKKRSEWYSQLQKLVNQYVLYVLEKDAPCRTCGTTNPNIKYDAGHYISRGARPELSFEITNIHKQCSVQCNQHGSGMRAEYRDFIIDKYGEDHRQWLEGPHPTLKEQFPHYTDIKAEIQRYRKLLRDNELTPRA